MSEITLHTGNGSSTTAVSNRFIDEYMTKANGEFVKVYLYLLRCMNSPDSSFSISKTADKFEHTEKDIQRALRYWEKMNLIRLEYDEGQSICGIYFLDSPAAKERDDAIPVKMEEACAADDMEAFRQKEDVKELLFVAESYLGRPLSPTDVQTILYWYDGLSFSADLVAYLLEYCIAGGHTSLHYMDKVALSWKDAGICTVEQAKRRASAHSRLHAAVMKSFGISGRSLIPAEEAYVEKWSKEMGFGPELISEACSRTILAIHRPSFEYADSILANWHKQGIRTMEGVASADAERQAAGRRAEASAKPPKPAALKAASNRFNSFPQRAYNIDQLETELLNTR